MTKAMLLCAGKGTRLQGLSDERPKPLLPVCDIPILRFGITHLVGHGIRDIVINLCHRGSMIRDELGDGRDLGAHIQYSVEDWVLGTGGGLKRALALLDPNDSDEPFLSLNGKLIFDLDIGALLAAHRLSQSLGMMVVRPASDAEQWGAIDVHADSSGMRVHNIFGTGDYMFCGVHVTRPSVVRALPDGEACMVRDGYLPWIQAGKLVHAFVHTSGYFAEHSTPARYLQSNLDLLGGAMLSYPPGVLHGIDNRSEIHPSAAMIPPIRLGAGVTVGAHCHVGPNVVVGAGSVVTSGSVLKDCVVWRNVTVAGTHQNSILTPERIMVI